MVCLTRRVSASKIEETNTSQLVGISFCWVPIKISCSSNTESILFHPGQQILGRFLVKAKYAFFSPFMMKKGGGSSFCTNKYVGSLEATACYVKQFHQHWPQCATLCSTGDLHLFPQLRSRRPCPVRASQGMCTWNPNHPCFSVNDLFFFGGCQPSKNRAKWVPRRGHIKSMFG